MRTAEIIETLSDFTGRGAGSDAERRAARWLRRELSAGRRTAELESFWCRPNWALAQAWHVALGLAGSLLSVSSPKVGAGMILAALLCVLADCQLGISPGRRLTPERASQNVVSRAPERTSAQPPVKLIITANYDAGRTGLAYRGWIRSVTARLSVASAGVSPGWAGWLAIGLVVTLGTALLRIKGHHDAAVAVIQLPATIGLVVALALLLELATSDWSPGASDNGSGVGVAIALARALDAAPPSHAQIELVLTGAGDGQGTGLRHHLRARRHELDPTNAVVLGIGPCGAGEARWLHSDGSLVPLAFFAGLRRMCAEVAGLDPALGLGRARGRGVSPALPARIRSLPAITLTALDRDNRAPRSHQPSDTPDAISRGPADALVQAGLLLTDAIDAYLGELRPG